MSVTGKRSCAHLSQRWLLTSAWDIKYQETTAIDVWGESRSGCKAAWDLQTQTLEHRQLKLALAPWQQAKVKILKMKRQHGMGHKGVLGRASPHLRQREDGGDTGLVGSGGTSKPHRPPLHPSPECGSSRRSGYLAQHRQLPALVYIAFSETRISLSPVHLINHLSSTTAALGLPEAVHIRGQSPLGSGAAPRTLVHSSEEGSKDYYSRIRRTPLSKIHALKRKYSQLVGKPVTV